MGPEAAYMKLLPTLYVGNHHVTPSSTLVDALLYFFCSISSWHCSLLLWYMNRHLRVKPLFFFYLYSLVSLPCTSAIHSFHWGTVFFCFSWLYTYHFVPRLICASYRIWTGYGPHLLKKPTITTCAHCHFLSFATCVTLIIAACVNCLIMCLTLSLVLVTCLHSLAHTLACHHDHY